MLPPLAEEFETPSVVVLHPEHVDADRLAAQMEALQTAVDTVPGASLRSLSASALYRTRDLVAGRAFDAVAATRLGGATHVVLVGSSRDHAAVGEEHHPVGVAGRAGVVGHHDDGLTEVVDGLAANGEEGNAAVEDKVRAEVSQLCARFPLYNGM